MEETGQKHRALYAAFDLFPTAKGASTHITQMADAMVQHFGGGLLFTLGNSLFPQQEIENNVEIKRFSDPIPHYLNRANGFGKALQQELTIQDKLELVHFRDIWSGLAVLKKERVYATVFEVNGLPSIELPYRYPGLPSTTLKKLYTLEQQCLEGADKIIVPSQVIGANLQKRGIPDKTIELVPNGADVHADTTIVPDLPSQYILYFGAVQPWQGVETLLRAFAQLKDHRTLQLVICCSGRERDTKNLKRLTRRLEIENQVIWKYQLDKSNLNSYIKNALLTVAPLTECKRNIQQGCAPLKILESMACGTMVIASDLPVTREIIADGVDGKLVQAERPEVLSRAIRIAIEYPDKTKKMALQGMKKIENKFSWQESKRILRTVYEKCIHEQ